MYVISLPESTGRRTTDYNTKNSAPILQHVLQELGWQMLEVLRNSDVVRWENLTSCIYKDRYFAARGTIVFYLLDTRYKQL